MKITWIGHAAFLIEVHGLSIITDPYSPEVMGLPSISESADIVIRSSSDDQAHCRADLISGSPVVVTATEIEDGARWIRGIGISSIAAGESLVFRSSPRKNALYKFSLEEITVVHFGDIGNELTGKQMEFLRGADIALVPAGGPPTIELHHLFNACRELRFPLIIPMHYAIPGARPSMLPVTAFTDRFDPDEVEWIHAPAVDVQKNSLPSATRVFVLSPLSVINKSVQEDRPSLVAASTSKEKS